MKELGKRIIRNRNKEKRERGEAGSVGRELDGRGRRWSRRREARARRVSRRDESWGWRTSYDALVVKNCSLNRCYYHAGMPFALRARLICKHRRIHLQNRRPTRPMHRDLIRKRINFRFFPKLIPVWCAAARQLARDQEAMSAHPETEVFHHQAALYASPVLFVRRPFISTRRSSQFTQIQGNATYRRKISRIEKHETAMSNVRGWTPGRYRRLRTVRGQ